MYQSAINRLFYKPNARIIESVKMTNNLDDEQIIAKIQRAINITKDLEEPYRSKAFEIILPNLLVGRIDSTSNEKKVEQKTPPSTSQEDTLNHEAKIESFASKCNVTPEQLKNVYHFEPEKPIYIVPFRGSDSDKQINVSRFLLAAYEEVYDVEWISLRKDLTEHGIKSLANLARNLDKHSELFRSKGQQKGTAYKLVDTAKLETFKMIRELALNNNN